jgi:protein-S-isoprenylcysteine O-methyltransferase Ste14
MFARVLRLPPVLFLLMATAAAVLQARYPLALGLPSFRWGMSAGIVVAAVAVTIAAAAFMEMRRHRTPVEPGQRPRSLVTSSVFSKTRNPLYVSLLLMMLAIALAANALWFVLAAVVLWIVLDRVVVSWEERTIGEAFPDEYREYKSRVRRWL